MLQSINIVTGRIGTVVVLVTTTILATTRHIVISVDVSTKYKHNNYILVYEELGYNMYIYI